MGSGGIYVAPVTVGDGAYSGAGALIRKDVPAGALAISEFSQRNIEGWVLKTVREPNRQRPRKPPTGQGITDKKAKNHESRDYQSGCA